jgi:hypothetical protein
MLGPHDQPLATAHCRLRCGCGWKEWEWLPKKRLGVCGRHPPPPLPPSQVTTRFLTGTISGLADLNKAGRKVSKGCPCAPNPTTL